MAEQVDLLLASASARRKALLEQIGVRFISEASDIDETPHPSESAEEYVLRLALDKALALVSKHNTLPILGSDTSVVIDGCILGKPATEQAAKDMLARLSGNRHQVLTAVAMCDASGVKRKSIAVSTWVTFLPLTSEQINAYVTTGEPMDKAGSYAIQGKAAIFIDGIEGSYSNVVGLPLTQTAQLLTHFNVPVWCD